MQIVEASLSVEDKLFGFKVVWNSFVKHFVDAIILYLADLCDSSLRKTIVFNNLDCLHG